ncbi:MAG TPA: PAS domain-containing protein [Pseudolabrys sp.]|nr:PAS domain-containing protein [Pseudolabrys sp.]
MTIAHKPCRPLTAPALFRLLSDSALSRAALGACPIPLAIIDAKAKAHPVTYANAAFQAHFGYGEAELIGRSLAALVFRGDESLVARLLAEFSSRWEVSAWTKDGELRHVELALRGVRDAEGEISHWVAAASDRDEVERLRAEVKSLRELAGASLGVRLEPGSQPARGAQQSRGAARSPDELDADRHSAFVLHQR